MIKTMQIVFETIRNYRGAGLFFVLFLLAMLYLFLNEEEKNRRIILIYSALTVIGIFVFPITSYVIMNYVMDTEIYYRQLWLIPYGVIVCYALVRLMIRMQRVIGKVAVFLAACLVIMVTGTNVFANDNFSRAKNVLHIPPEAVHVCDAILDDDIEYILTAAFPMRLVEYTRQYTAEIVTVYGREAIITRWNLPNELLELIEAPELNAQKLATVGRSQGAECIVVEAVKPMNGRMEDYNYYLIETVDGFDIYMEKWLAQRHNGFVLPEEENAE